MASYCPNPACGRKLRLTDWRQTCPGCGVNLLYYNMATRLEAEADRVEQENAAFQKRMDRTKAALIGNKLAIARLVCLVLPAAALLLPLGKLTLNAPFAQKSTTINLISLITKGTGLDFGALAALLHTPALAPAVVCFFLALLGVALALLACVAGVLTCFLAGGPKGFLRASLFTGTGMFGSLLSAAAWYGFARQTATALPGAVIATVGPGIFVVLLTFVLLLGINLVIRRQGGIPVEYKPCTISGFPEEEVYAAFAQGLTLSDLRSRRAAEEAAAEEQPAHV